jgi:hypothetical protein
MTRQLKYEMHAAICYKIPVPYRKSIADPKSSYLMGHGYVK